MKTSSLIAIGAAVLGFGSAWLLKPGASDPIAETTGAPPRPRPDRSKLVAPGDMNAARISARIAKATGPSNSDGTELVTARMGKSFDTLKKRRDNAKLLRLSEALGLSEEQEDAIAKLLEARTNAFNPYNEDPTKRGDLLELAANAEGSFEKSLQAILDEDQLSRLDAYKTRTIENRIEVQAQQQLTKLMQSVDLSTAQRDAALEIYREKSIERVESAPQGWDLLNDSNNLAGGGTSHADRYRELLSDPAVANDPKAFKEKLIEDQKEQVEEKLNTVEDLLTPAQLEAYKASLQTVGDFLETVSPPTQRDPRFQTGS